VNIPAGEHREPFKQKVMLVVVDHGRHTHKEVCWRGYSDSKNKSFFCKYVFGLEIKLLSVTYI
jgi:hypothetical protein